MNFGNDMGFGPGMGHGLGFGNGMGLGDDEANQAVARRHREQEEEAMTAYGPGDLAGNWEFKILRSVTAGFRNPERLRAILEEERRGGWVLVEKFDDARVRLKRPAGAKAVAGDFADGYDPYRTIAPLSTEERARNRVVIGIVAGIFGLVVAIPVVIGILDRMR